MNATTRTQTTGKQNKENNKKTPAARADSKQPGDGLPPVPAAQARRRATGRAITAIFYIPGLPSSWPAMTSTGKGGWQATCLPLFWRAFGRYLGMVMWVLPVPSHYPVRFTQRVPCSTPSTNNVVSRVSAFNIKLGMLIN